MTTAEEVLITVTGRDHPGITAALARTLEEGGAELLDVEQVVVQGRLTLCLLVRAARSTLDALLPVAREHAVELDELPVLARPTPRTARFVVTVIGRRLGASELHAVAAELAAHDANIERIGRLSDGPLAALEIDVSVAPEHDPLALKRALLAAGMHGGFDVALQKESIHRRSKRLVVMDMDSTLIQVEVIDELARAHGVYEEVARVTERAMAGEMDYDTSLKERVSRLRGLPVSVLERIASTLPLTEGADVLLRTLRRLGYRTAVISGGFSVAAEALRRRLSIDEAHSNVLEVEAGVLTGRVVGPIVNAQRKAELLEAIAARENVLLDQTIAVGDGANDLLMLQRAGLGIAFRARPRLREAAATSISAAGLDAILYLLGLSARELAELG